MLEHFGGWGVVMMVLVALAAIALVTVGVLGLARRI